MNMSMSMKLPCIKWQSRQIICSGVLVIFVSVIYARYALWIWYLVGNNFLMLASFLLSNQAGNIRQGTSYSQPDQDFSASLGSLFSNGTLFNLEVSFLILLEAVWRRWAASSTLCLAKFIRQICYFPHYCRWQHLNYYHTTSGSRK